MTVRVTQSIHDFSPTVEWDEESRMVADNLSIETIWKLKERLYELYEACNTGIIQGTPEEVQAGMLQRASYQGAIEFIKGLLEDDKNVKGRLAIAQT